MTTALNHQGTNKKEGAQDRYLNHHIWDRAQVQRGAWEATQVKKTPCTQQTRVQTQEGRNELPRTYKNKRERQRYKEPDCSVTVIQFIARLKPIILAIGR